MIAKLFWIAGAGAVGTLARYWLGGVVARWTGESFPWGTLVVNVLGSYLFGVVWVLGMERMRISAEMRTIILIGFMGAFTTFSTFAFETGQMLTESQWLHAFANIAAQLVLGLVGLFLGFATGRWL